MAQEIVGEYGQDSRLSQAGQPLCMMFCPLLTAIADGEQRRDNVLVRHKQGDSALCFHVHRRNCRPAHDKLKTVINPVDEFMCQSKRTGKNCVTVG